MTATTATTPTRLSHRDRSVLRAVLAGRCRVTGHAVLLVDGVGCCDQFLGRRLLRDGLIAPPGPEPAPARLTPAGLALLSPARPVRPRPPGR